MPGDRISLLGVRLETATQEDYKNHLRTLLGRRGGLVVTPNPEMLVYANRHPAVSDVLNAAALRIVDGFGVVLMGWLRKAKLTQWSGIDVLEWLAGECESGGQKLLLAGGLYPEDAKQAADLLKKRHPGLVVRSFGGGVITQTETGWEGDRALKDVITEEEPDVLILALGHGKQELWLADHLSQFPSIRIAMGVGGAIEFLSGRQKRAPRWVHKMGFEWLYRVLREPKRIGRILTALVVFPLLALWDQLRHNQANT